MDSCTGDCSKDWSLLLADELLLLLLVLRTLLLEEISEDIFLVSAPSSYKAVLIVLHTLTSCPCC